MKAVKNLVEYYDELFPVSEAQKSFFSELANEYGIPSRFLRLGCGSGLFETMLSRAGHDVTGIECCEEFLKMANMRRRSQLMSIRFFDMSLDEMVKYLGKKFYNVVSILDSRIIFYSREEIVKLFSVVKDLLSDGGMFLIQTFNFEGLDSGQMIQLPVKESLRSKLFTEIWSDEQGKRTLNVSVENSSGRISPVVKNIPVYPLLPSEIESIAESTGWSSAEFFADFNKTSFTGNEDSFIVILK